MGELPEGAVFSVLGPTPTPARQWVACIMDYPGEYFSRTLSIGFGETAQGSMDEALRLLPEYPPKTWPYRNRLIDGAIEDATEANRRAVASWLASEAAEKALAEALVAKLPAIHRWLTVGWKDTQKHESGALARAILSALKSGEPS